MRAIWIPITLLLLLQGCSGFGRREHPAPVTDAGTSTPSAPQRPAMEAAPVDEESGVEVYAYRQGKAPAFAPNRPVLVLVEKAEAQRAAGDLAGAAATLERALRIEPRNPHLLNRLARVRLQQGSYDQADSLASKSNALAGDAPALQRDNLSIIAEARRASGR